MLSLHHKRVEVCLVHLEKDAGLGATISGRALRLEKTRQSTTWVQQEEDIFLPGAWPCRDERRLGHGIILCPSSIHTT